MELSQLQKQIIDNSLKDMYIFTGTEIAVQKIYINKIASVKQLEVEYVENFKSIYNKLQQTDIFNTKKLYVVLDDTELLKEEKVYTTLTSLNYNNNLVIFKFNTLDKRSKFYKQYQEDIVEFTTLSTDILKQYIKKDLPNLNDDNCLELISICNNDYNQILLEIDKIKHYSDKNINIDFTLLNMNGAFHKEIADITFDFVDKVLRRDIIQIYNLKAKLTQINESNVKLLSLLYTNFKTILLIQSCESKDICKTTGLQYYQVKYNQDKVNIYSIGELVYILRKIQSIEQGIKIGTIEEAIALDYLLLSIL